MTQMAVLLVETHKAVLEKDLDLAKGYLAAGYQFVEFAAVNKLDTEIGWACIHLPPINTSDFTATKNAKILGAPAQKVIPRLVEAEIFQAHARVLRQIKDTQAMADALAKGQKDKDEASRRDRLSGRSVSGLAARDTGC